MKRRCKEIDITDVNTIIPFIADCLRRHYKRHDFHRFLIEYGLTEEEYQVVCMTYDYTIFDQVTRKIAEYCAENIKNRTVTYREPSLRKRKDHTTGKVRDITCETPLNQVYDFIAIHAAMPAFKARLVKEQASGMEGRGQTYGAKLIAKIARKDEAAADYAVKHGKRYSRKCRYHVKVDIRKCFPSMRKEVFMDLFRHDCNNSDLIYLFDTILGYHRVGKYKGFLIGSVVSQWAAQYVISFIYRYVAALRDSRGRRLVHRCVVWMDDILLIGPNRKSLMKAVKLMREYALRELRLKMKVNWHIQQLDRHPIDMMGFRVYRSGRTGIRRRNWRKTRRMLIRIRHSASESQALRAMSFKGFIKHSNSFKIRNTYNTAVIFSRTQKLLSKRSKAYEGSELQGTGVRVA